MKRIQKNKPKILIFVHTLEMGGLQINLLKTVKYLKDEFEFHMAVFKKINSILEKESRLYLQNFYVLNEEIFTLDISKKCVAKIQNLIREVSPQLIESHLFFIDIKVREAAKKEGFKNVIIYQHGFGNGWDAKMRDLEWRYFPYTKHYICVSEWNKNVLVNTGIPKNMITVIYNGIDSKLFECNCNTITAKFKGEKFNIGFIGRIEPSKNPLILPDIVDIMVNTYKLKNFQFHIVGDGSLKSLLKDKIASKRLDTYFKFYGEIPYVEIQDVYKKVDLLLLTSKCESMPNVIIEALINEIPVVVPPIGGIPEIVENGQNGFFAKSPEECARVIAQFMENPSLYEKVKKNIRSQKEYYYQRFSLERFLKERRKLWMRLLQKHTVSLRSIKNGLQIK